MFSRTSTYRAALGGLMALATAAPARAARAEWRLNAGSVVAAAPAVGGNGTTYVGAGDGSLEAIDANGVVKWSYMLDGSVASPPVIDAADRVYVATTAGRLYAFLPSGTRAWQVSPPARVTTDLALAPWGLVFGASDGSVWAASDRGTLLWHSPLHEVISAGPAVRANRVVVGAISGDVVFSDGASRRFTAKLDAPVRGAPVVFSDGSAAVLAGGAIQRLDARAAPLWRHEGVAWMVSGGAGLVAVETNGDLVELSSDGKVANRTPLGASVSGPPAVSPAGHVYVPTDSGELLVVRRGAAVERVAVAPTPLHRPVLDLARHRVVVGAGGGTVAAVEVDE